MLEMCPSRIECDKSETERGTAGRDKSNNAQFVPNYFFSVSSVEEERNEKKRMIEKCCGSVCFIYWLEGRPHSFMRV